MTPLSKDELPLAPRWDESREDAIAERVVQTYRRRRAVKGAAIATAALMIAGVVALQFAKTDRIELDDGTVIAKADASTDVEVVTKTAELVEAHLKSGRARFSVHRNPARLFRVRSGDVTVEVLGTVFEVEQIGEITRVGVREGRVRVTSGGNVVILGAGDTRELATHLEQPVISGEAAEEAPEPPPVEEAPVAKNVVQSLADALLDVDRLRLAGRPNEAAAVLQRSLKAHPNDAQSAQATFMLGRILQDDLGDLPRAQATFASLRRRWPKAVLLEDALAREIECLAGMHEAERARDLVRVYDETFRRGVHRERLHRLVAP